MIRHFGLQLECALEHPQATKTRSWTSRWGNVRSARASSEDEKMRTFDIYNNGDRLSSFQISSWMGRRRASKVIGNIPGANVMRVTSGFSWNPVVPNRDNVVCEFEFGGIKFEVSEDWGDSSRYWIGPMDRVFHPETEVIKEAFTKFSWWKILL